MEPQAGLPEGSGSGALEALLESLDSWTALVDADGRIATVNSAWRGYKGANPFVAGLAPGDDYGAVAQRLAASPDGNLSIVALGLTAVLRGKVPRLRLEFPFKQETTSWFGVVARRKDDRVVLHHVDLTERMKVMQRLHKAESLFKATSEYATDLISVLDTEGKVVFSSHSHHKVLGFPEPEWRAIQLEDLIHPSDRADYRRVILDAFRSGLSPFFEYRLRDRQGGWHCFEGRAAMIETSSASQETVLLISRDVSGRKQAELERDTLEVQLRQAQKLEAVGQLAAGIPLRIRDQVFLPFFTTKAVGKGTGQGLAIVHSVVVKHGGTVAFETEEGKGTVFTVRLPIAGPPSAED